MEQIKLPGTLALWPQGCNLKSSETSVQHQASSEGCQENFSELLQVNLPDSASASVRRGARREVRELFQIFGQNHGTNGCCQMPAKAPALSWTASRFSKTMWANRGKPSGLGEIDIWKPCSGLACDNTQLTNRDARMCKRSGPFGKHLETIQLLSFPFGSHCTRPRPGALGIASARPQLHQGHLCQFHALGLCNQGNLSAN